MFDASEWPRQKAAGCPQTGCRHLLSLADAVEIFIAAQEDSVLDKNGRCGKIVIELYLIQDLHPI